MTTPKWEVTSGLVPSLSSALTICSAWSWSRTAWNSRAYSAFAASPLSFSALARAASAPPSWLSARAGVPAAPRQSNRATNRRLRELSFLHEIAQLATLARDWDELMRTIVDGTTEAMGVEDCSFYLADREEQVAVVERGVEIDGAPVLDDRLFELPGGAKDVAPVHQVGRRRRNLGLRRGSREPHQARTRQYRWNDPHRDTLLSWW